MFEQTFSLEKSTEFIGREVILADVRSWLRDGQFHAAFFSGEYGIGKTRLFQRILEVAHKELKYDGVPTHLIDLYHFRHHSPEGLARAIFACFENTDNEGFFQFYITARRKLEEARAAGDTKAIREQLERLLDTCVDGLKNMSAARGLLLLFDTAEQFVYPTGTRFAPAWEWLKGWIGDLTCGAVLFAGRPIAGALFQQSSLPQLAHIPLDFFTPEESSSYLLATADKWSKENNLPFNFAMEEAPRLHILSQGRPILLSIFLELRMRDPQAFKDLSGLETESFEQKIIDYILSLPELGETLKAAGRAPKGIDADLLSKIRGIPIRQARQALENLKKLSFAKTFAGDEKVNLNDERVYLHDEMYFLLAKYPYSEIADIADGQAAAQAIYNYYKQAIRQKDEELKGIFASLTEELDFKQFADTTEDYVPKIRELEVTRQRLKTEFVYYRLRHQVEKEGKRKAYEDDPILAGLKMYYRFGHEACTSNNDEILIPLQIELTNFWLGLEDGNFWKPFIEGLLLVHEIWLKVATGQSYWHEIPDYEKRLDSIPALVADQKAILHALLETWLGTGLIFSEKPDYERGQKTFTNVIDNLPGLSIDKRLGWFKYVMISLVYRQRAYTHRIRGAFEDAIKDFQEGLHYSRALHFNHEEATLRNDLGFAQMQAGFFQSAFENIWDGLQLRYRVAIGHRIALSYSSLAQHYIATGAYEEARKHAQYAIRSAGAVGFRRGLGFGNLAYAESTRRFAFSAQGPSNRAEYLQQAQDAIEIAIYLLNQMGEIARIIDAKLEQACLYRDRVRVETESSRRKTWFEKSDTQFQEVAKASEDAGIAYRLVDAKCNRVWLGYFAHEIEHAEEAVREFEALDILKPYWLKNGEFVDKTQAEENPQLWSQIGKYYVGRGMMTLEKWGREKKEHLLKDAAHFTMLGLTYSTTFAEDHRGLREGRRTVRQALASLDPEELGRFSQYVLEAEKSEKIKKRPSALQTLMRDAALWFEVEPI